MACRVSEHEVKAIMDTALEVEIITPFLHTANVIVTSRLTGAGYASDLLKQIEKWLAAHFVAVRDPDMEAERTGTTTETRYRGKTAMGLDFTPYGQQVRVLDWKGILDSAIETGSKSVVSFHTFG